MRAKIDIMLNRLAHFWQQRDYPGLVAFAGDAQRVGEGQDSAGQIQRLADPQAAGIDQAETAPVDRIADAIENAPRLGMGKGLRQPLLLRKPDLFLNSAQSLPSVFR